MAMKKPPLSRENQEIYKAVSRAIKKSARQARQIARMHGTPVYIWKNGRVVAEKP
jgi:hypothetical protein